MEGKSDTHAQEDHATSYLHLHLHYGKKKKWSLHYKKVEGKSDAHAQEEHATHRTVTILSHVIKWTRLIGHSRACVVNIFIFGGGMTPPTKTGYEMTPTYYSQPFFFLEIKPHIRNHAPHYQRPFQYLIRLLILGYP